MTDQHPQDDAQQPQDAPETPTQAPEGRADENAPQDAPETFPREYVEQLRKEAAEARVKAKHADSLAERLHLSLVAATGRLADPTDLPFDAAHLEDEQALTAAIDALLDRKPHLAARRLRGNVGQGVTSGSDTVSLASILRANA